MWLGDTYVAAHEYHGRTTDTQQTTVPMHYLHRSDGQRPQDLIVAKEGDGRLYYRLGLRYAPTESGPRAAGHGLHRAARL